MPSERNNSAAGLQTGWLHGGEIGPENTQLNHSGVRVCVCVSCWPGAIAPRSIKDRSVLLLPSRQRISGTGRPQTAVIDQLHSILARADGLRKQLPE